jgi:hypothetical protein
LYGCHSHFLLGCRPHSLLSLSLSPPSCSSSLTEHTTCSNKVYRNYGTPTDSGWKCTCRPGAGRDALEEGGVCYGKPALKSQSFQPSIGKCNGTYWKWSCSEIDECLHIDRGGCAVEGANCHGLTSGTSRFGNTLSWTCDCKAGFSRVRSPASDGSSPLTWTDAVKVTTCYDNPSASACSQHKGASLDVCCYFLASLCLPPASHIVDVLRFVSLLPYPPPDECVGASCRTGAGSFGRKDSWGHAFSCSDVNYCSSTTSGVTCSASNHECYNLPTGFDTCGCKQGYHFRGGSCVGECRI